MTTPQKPSVIEPTDASRMTQTAVGNIRRRLETLESTQQTMQATLSSSQGSVSVSSFNALVAQVAALAGKVAVVSVPVQVNGLSVGAEQILNFIAGTGVFISGIDEVGSRIDIRISIPQNFSQTISEVGNAMDTVVAYKNLNPFARPANIYHPGRKPASNQFNARSPGAYVTQINSLFLCHFDGTNGQTTYTDVYGHTITNHGAALTTTNPKFGTASLNCTGNYVQVANDAAFTIGTGDATLEGWVNWISGNNQVYISKRTGTSSNSWFLFDNFSAFFFYINKGGTLTQIGNSVATPTTNTWHHFALVKFGTTAMLFWDGVQQGSTLTGITGSVTDDGSDIVIGAGGTDGSLPANTVQFDDIRYSNIARYTANFTPPTGPFAF